jgi:hypothetical protein
MLECFKRGGAFKYTRILNVQNSSLRGPRACRRYPARKVLTRNLPRKVSLSISYAEPHNQLTSTQHLYPARIPVMTVLRRQRQFYASKSASSIS